MKKQEKCPPLTLPACGGDKGGERGSAIIWIFVMIALFAALAAFMSRGTRTGQDSIGAEQAQLAATETLTFTTQLRNAVKTLRINGCQDTQLSFENTVYILNDGTQAQPDSLYPNAPTDNHCDIFHPDGANIRPVIMKQAQIPIPHSGGNRTGHLYFFKIAVPDIGTSAADLLAVIPHIQQEVCYAINDQLGISDSAAPRSNYLYSPYDGDFTSSSTYDNNVAGLSAACFSDSIASDQDPLYMHFYQVLLAR